MRNLSLSTTFDLTHGESSRHRPQTLLARNNPFARARNAILPSGLPSKHRGTKGPSADTLTTTPADRSSTPITELYHAIGKICGDGCSPESTTRTARREHTTSHGISVVPSSFPSDILCPEIRTPRRSARAPEVESELYTVIYETSPKSRPVISTPAPHRGREVAPLDTPSLATGGGKLPVGSPPCRRSQRSKQAKRAPQTRRGDELVLLCRVPATMDTLSQRRQPDPRSPLAQRPQATLPTHPCCSLVRRDAKEMEDAAYLRAPLVRSQFYGARLGLARTHLTPSQGLA